MVQMRFLSRIAFAVASGVLILLAMALMAYGLSGPVIAMRNSWLGMRDAVIQAVSYVVIAIAVFDVAKYFLEEEVVQIKGKQTLSEARISLTRFITTIIIAVFIEGLVGVFEVSNKQPAEMVYPVFLLLTATLMVLVLGVYQRMSIGAEKERKEKDLPE